MTDTADALVPATDSQARSELASLAERLAADASRLTGLVGQVRLHPASEVAPCCLCGVVPCAPHCSMHVLARQHAYAILQAEAHLEALKALLEGPLQTPGQVLETACVEIRKLRDLAVSKPSEGFRDGEVQVVHSGRRSLVVFRGFQIGPLHERQEDAQEHAAAFRAALTGQGETVVQDVDAQSTAPRE